MNPCVHVYTREGWGEEGDSLSSFHLPNLNSNFQFQTSNSQRNRKPEELELEPKSLQVDGRD